MTDNVIATTNDNVMDLTVLPASLNAIRRSSASVIESDLSESNMDIDENEKDLHDCNMDIDEMYACLFLIL